MWGPQRGASPSLLSSHLTIDKIQIGNDGLRAYIKSKKELICASHIGDAVSCLGTPF